MTPTRAAVIIYNGHHYDLDLMRSLTAQHHAAAREDQRTHADEWEATGLDPAGTLERFFNNPPTTEVGERAFLASRQIAYRVLGTINTLPRRA